MMDPALFQQQLSHLRDLSKEFAKEHPALAPLLLSESADPDVERILEGTAFLAAMVGQKVDDQLPEIIHTLTQTIFPHYLKPIPSMAIMHLMPKPGLMEPITIPSGTRFGSITVDGTSCTFASASEMRFYPLTLTDCGWLREVTADGATLKMQFSTQGVPLSAWNLDAIRFYCAGDFAAACERYRMLFSHVKRITVREHGTSREMVLDGNMLNAVGFTEEDALLPYSRRSFAGFRILQEYFVFPEKFLFLELSGLLPFTTGVSANGFDIEFLTDASFASSVPFRKDFIHLHAVPVLNLFEHEAEPVQLNFKQSDYKVIPAGNNLGSYQIHSITSVSGIVQGKIEERQYRPFELFSFEGDTTPVYTQIFHQKPQHTELEWCISTTRPGSEEAFQDRYQPETLSIHLLCSNGTLPSALKLGDISEPTDNSPVLATFENVTVPTPYYKPRISGDILWRLVSHMYVNYFPISELTNLRSLLHLYIQTNASDKGAHKANLKRIEAILELHVENQNRLIDGIMMRGVVIKLVAEPAGFSSKGDMLLFGSVLDNFFSSYAAVNCFTAFSMQDYQTKEEVSWPARLGSRFLL